MSNGNSILHLYMLLHCIQGIHFHTCIHKLVDMRRQEWEALVMHACLLLYDSLASVRRDFCELKHTHTHTHVLDRKSFLFVSLLVGIYNLYP